MAKTTIRCSLAQGPIRCLLAVGLLALNAEAQVTLEARSSTPTESTPSPLTLEDETIQTRIDTQHATTVITQRYLNPSAVPLEGVCLVRAGINTKVQGYSYWNGTSKIRGEVFEKEAARAIYEETTGLRRDPGLLEQTGEGAFTFRVFPIQPQEHKRVEVVISQRLARIGRHVEYRIPLASRNANVSIELTDPRPLNAFESSTHQLTRNATASGWTILATPKTQSEKELIFGYDVEQAPFQLSVVKHEDVGQPAYLAISLGTDPTAEQSAKDVTIVLDHSGSMDGSPLSEARAAAKEIVSRLTPRDRLNVIAFDDRVDSLYPHMEPVTPKNRESALRFLDSIQSGGGTDLALALREALKKQRPTAERPLVLLLTDGASDAQSAFDAIGADTSKTRVFTVGIGAGVNRPLLSRLSDLKRGRFTYIQSADAIRPSIHRLFNLVETAVLRNLELSVENGQLKQLEPSTLPDLAPGEELLVSTRATGTGPIRIALKAIGARGPFETTTTVHLGTPSTHPWVGRLWAQARTNRLLEDVSLYGETDERKTEVVELALSYGFVTPYTSFLAIPETELTESTSTLMSEMRAKKRAILAKRSDAVALSRSEMPPGDPVLSVDAPVDALRVTAYFPFGLEKDLKYDPEVNRWRVRFLVPKTVTNGTYTVPVLVVHRDGHAELLSGRYTIDSSEPQFETFVDCSGGRFKLSVVTQEPMREVRAAFVTEPQKRFDVLSDPKDRTGTRYIANLKLLKNETKVRVVVSDRARNEAEEVVACPEVEPPQ